MFKIQFSHSWPGLIKCYRTWNGLDFKWVDGPPLDTRDMLYRAPPLLVAVNGYMRVSQSSSTAIWCLNLVEHDYQSSKPSWYGKQKNKRLIVRKGLFDKKIKASFGVKLSLSSTDLGVSKNSVFRLKCGYRCCCHMQWQLGSRGSYHEKDIVVRLTWEIYLPNKWYD